MPNVPPNQRPPGTGWGPPPGGYPPPGGAQPPPPPPPPPPQAPGWQQQQPPPGGGYGDQQQPYGYQQQPYGQQYPPPPQKPPGRVLSIIAFALAGIALIFLPPFMMIAGVILSIIAITKGDSLGKWALGASIAGGVLGMIIGVLVLGLMD